MERISNNRRSLSRELNKRARKRKKRVKRLKTAAAVASVVLGGWLIGTYGHAVKDMIMPDSISESSTLENTNSKEDSKSVKGSAASGQNAGASGSSGILGNTTEEKYNEVSAMNNSSGTIKERLGRLNNQDSRIKDIIINYNNYPEELLDMLSRNIDMIDFVADYQSKKGKIYSDNIGTVNKGEVPLLLQWDERWGYGNYGESCIAVSGCAPTCLSMVIAGLTGDNSITPYDVGKYSEENGFYVKGTGTSWSLMTTGSSHFGIKGKEISLSENVIYNELKAGHPIICSMRKGDFTTTGHFIVLTGVKDGKIKVNDPNSTQRSEILWEYDRLESQIKNLWAFSK